MVQSMLQLVKETLCEDDRLCSDGRLLRNKIMELTHKQDEKLINLLLSNDGIKEHFFTEVNGTLVFDKDEFIKFVNNKQFLPDSYTTFKNKIGLTSDGEYLDKKKEVALAWPYKDCVLEGEQADPDEDRKEIFWNEILAPDEIDRLLDPKALTNFKRVDKEGKSENLGLQSDDNLLIRGNNFLALHSLKKRFRGKIKLIYIDPPFNTGNDGFKYNDKFNQSTWLTFMKNRLEIAKELLCENGLIMISIGEKEVYPLKVLMDEIFPSGRFVNNILTRRYDKNINLQFVGEGLKSLNVGAEHVLVYSKNEDTCINPVYREPEKEERASQGYWKGFWNSADRPTMRYELLGFKPEKGQWKWCKERAMKAVKNYEEYKKKHKDEMTLEEYWRKTGKEKEFIKRNPEGSGKNKGVMHWISPSDKILRSSNWTDILASKPAKHVEFSSPKNPELIKKLIKMGTNEKDIILDFFAGSGTTAQAVLELNQDESNSDRTFVLCEQLNYIEDVTLKRVRSSLKDESFVYCELMKWNQKYIDKIKEADAESELLEIWKEIKEEAFLSYKLNPREFDENVDGFQELSLEDQKRFLIECLDKNHLYVNLSEIDDEEYDISEEDKEMNKQFYGGL